MSKPSTYSRSWIVTWLAVLLAIGTADVQATSYYVWSGAPSEGSGSKASPFKILASAEAAAKEGDTIFVSTIGSLAPLDGGIALKPGQKLIGLGPDGKPALHPSSMARLTNSTEHLKGVLVQLSERNEVAGIRFVDLRNHGIHGAGLNYSGARIHHNWFTGAAKSEDLIQAVLLEANSGAIKDVRVEDILVQDGEDLAGIQVMHTGDSTGEYEFARNQFSDLGGRAYLVWSRGTSKIQSRILDSTADNIGRGNRNADSIDPRLWGSTEQNMLVRNYHYNNTKQVGSRSNTGLEAFIMGEPFRDRDEWAKNCKLTLEIVDCVFENTITDGIQLTNYGTNSTLDIKIRNTKVIGANPGQAGGGISLIAQNAQNKGSHTKLLVENCDIINSSRYGFAISDRGEGFTSIVDLGGGPLGSSGNNRVINAAAGEIQVINANPVAKHNYWGGRAPRTDVQGDKSTLNVDDALPNDPRGD
jgi:hypothetical protein